MSGLRNRVRRLVKLTQEPSDTLVLLDGSLVQLGPNERSEAFLAAFNNQSHRLLDLVESGQIDPERNEASMQELVSFLLAFNANAEEEA